MNFMEILFFFFIQCNNLSLYQLIQILCYWINALMLESSKYNQDDTKKLNFDLTFCQVKESQHILVVLLGILGHSEFVVIIL